MVAFPLCFSLTAQATTVVSILRAVRVGPPPCTLCALESVRIYHFHCIREPKTYSEVYQANPTTLPSPSYTSFAVDNNVIHAICLALVEALVYSHGSMLERTYGSGFSGECLHGISFQVRFKRLW